MKKQLDELAVAEHEIEEQVNANNEGHVRTQNDIVRQRMENSQLAEKVASGEKAMQSRDQVLKELQERLAKTEAEIERLERQNGRLRWKAESGVSNHFGVRMIGGWEIAILFLFRIDQKSGARNATKART